MGSGRIRSTRKLRCWMVDQVNSDKYPGLIWDDEVKTMFRIPWKHAGKQDFRSDEDAAIFKAWAEFKGKLSEGGRADPASWKTRMRCALNKSPEFEEVADRSQLDISDPYKVYRLVPVNEQALDCRDIKSRGRPGRKTKRESSQSDSEEDKPQAKQMKEEVISPVPICTFVQDMQAVGEEVTIQLEEFVPPEVTTKKEHTGDEIQLDVRMSTAPPSKAEHTFHVSVCYLGKVVLQRDIMGNDVRIAYRPSSPTPPTPPDRFPRILLPEPSPLLAASPDSGSLQALSTLLPFMDKGVLLTSTPSGIYASRSCQGRVYWTGPHTSTKGPHKMERTITPVLLFSKDLFSQELDRFRLSEEAPPPQCGVTLCFGEELLDSEDPSSKLIISRITFPWAQQQVQEVRTFKESMAILQNLGEVTINLVPVPTEDQSQAFGSTLL